ncbi:MAG TPA: TadE/TadG family type IV pilus assembly protein [Bryobacteraceae bacterium]|nr:TadE/TadG family type IV pilus assembly protein [Bryobacteraceae bacterium]
MLGLKWFGKPMERRAGSRRAGSPLTAAYWNGAAPAPRSVRNIDPNGAFIESAEPWRPGTMIHMALEPQREGDGTEEVPTFGLWARIVRSQPDGMAVQFVFENRSEHRQFLAFLAALGVEGGVMKRRKAGGGAERGQALIECALVLPMMVLLILNVVNVGAFLYAWITVANAARSGAQYMIIGGAMVTTPPTPTEAQVTALVQRDLLALPNQAGVQVRVCSNNQFRSPTVVCVGSGTTTPPPVEPETLPSGAPAPYVLGTVDVRYAYRPLVPLAVLTLPPATIHYRSFMRFLQ